MFSYLTMESNNYDPSVLQPWIDFFSNEVMEMPVTGRPPDKRSFIPSKWEKQRVGYPERMIIVVSSFLVNQYHFVTLCHRV